MLAAGCRITRCWFKAAAMLAFLPAKRACVCVYVRFLCVRFVCVCAKRQCTCCKGKYHQAWKKSRCACKMRGNCAQARSLQRRHANTPDTYGVFWARAPQIPRIAGNRHVDHTGRRKGTCAPMVRGRERASIVSRCCTKKHVATLALSFPVQSVAPILKGTEVDIDNGWPAAPDKRVRLCATIRG